VRSLPPVRLPRRSRRHRAPPAQPHRRSPACPAAWTRACGQESPTLGRQVRSVRSGPRGLRVRAATCRAGPRCSTSARRDHWVPAERLAPVRHPPSRPVPASRPPRASRQLRRRRPGPQRAARRSTRTAVTEKPATSGHTATASGWLTETVRPRGITLADSASSLLTRAQSRQERLPPDLTYEHEAKTGK
jgi:hypothetical protein